MAEQGPRPEVPDPGQAPDKRGLCHVWSPRVGSAGLSQGQGCCIFLLGTGLSLLLKGHPKFHHLKFPVREHQGELHFKCAFLSHLLSTQCSPFIHDKWAKD